MTTPTRYAALFPAAPAGTPLTPGARLLAASVQVTVVLGAAVVLLLRVPGIPAWDTIYAEDYSEFLIGALQHPWHLFIQYNGYEQLLPRVVAQLVTYLPLADVARGFAGAGALTAACCALFVYHASAGHIRLRLLRLLLAAGVILLSAAPLEIADSTVDAPWYLLLALFWAVLWRPRTRAGMILAAVIALVAAASTTIDIVFVPLLALRVYALRHLRDQAVTAGWLAGCLIQLPLVVQAAVSGQSRLTGDQDPDRAPTSRVADSLSFYLHDVVLRTIGWHLSWWLTADTTQDRATAIVAVALILVFGAILATQPGARPFTVVAVAAGFVFTVVALFLTPWAALAPVALRAETAARYTALPIFLLESALIVAADCALRRRPPPPGRRLAWPGPRPAAAVAALVVLLAAGWATDFRYPGARSAPAAHAWSAVTAQWEYDCRDSLTGTIQAQVQNGQWTIPCDRLRT